MGYTHDLQPPAGWLPEVLQEAVTEVVTLHHPADSHLRAALFTFDRTDMLREIARIGDRSDEAEMLVRHCRNAVELAHHRPVVLHGRRVDVLDLAEHAL